MLYLYVYSLNIEVSNKLNGSLWFQFIFLIHLHRIFSLKSSFWNNVPYHMCLIEPCSEKTCPRGFRSVQTQTVQPQKLDRFLKFGV